MKLLREILKIIAGSVFIFSGLSKAIDPSGSMYKFIDYFTAFGLDALDGVSLIAGIALSTLEFVAGFSMISGIRARESVWVMAALMLVFTPLTFVLALNNPVSDCGCFGDALHLTNWQTFYKNLIISAVIIVLLLQRKELERKFCRRLMLNLIISVSVLFIVFSIYNYKYLPVVDFRPYAEGVSIMEGKSIPEGAPVDEYDITLIYEKDGTEQEFTLENYPSDTSWTFVDQRSKLVKKGYTPPIHDFILTDIDGIDLTDEILNYDGFTIMMISTRIGDAGPEDISFGSELAEQAISAGFRFSLLTYSGTEDALSQFPPEVYLSGDETMLKTVIRSNPGYILMKEGIILKKWPHLTMPEVPELVEKMNRYGHAKKDNNNLIFILLLSFTIIASWLTGYLSELRERRKR